MASTGYIKISRHLLDWEWSDNPNTLALWIHLLLDASWEDKKWQGNVVERGALITSLSKLSIDVGESIGAIRVGLARLVECGAIEVATTNKWTKITICNYESYQRPPCDEQQANSTQQEGVVSGVNERVPSSPLKETIDRIYSLYPTKCPVSGRATGKGSKDKRKIESLLRNGHSEEELSKKILRYISDCTNDGAFIKNFQTFLNNLPDYGVEEIWPEEQGKEPIVYYQSLEELEAARRRKNK